MSPSVVEAESVLAIDVGAASTRAVLLDVVEGEYRLVAASSSPSTAEAPFKDIGVGVRAALTNLQALTGRTVLDASGRLITPSQMDGTGVDSVVSTLSAGPTLKTAVIGLLSDVSVESARRLAETCYTRVVDTTDIADPRAMDVQIDNLMRLQPDVVIVGGGTDGGASRSVQKMIESVGLSSFLLAPERRPAVLFAGNQELHAQVKDLLSNVAGTLHFSPNVRPSLDTEDLGPASRELARLYLDIRKRQLRGIEQLDVWSAGTTLPTAYAAGRMIRFLTAVSGDARAGALGINLGSSAAVIAAGFKTGTTLKVFPQFGLGENLVSLLQYTSLDDILRWSSIALAPALLRDFLYQKALHPAGISVTAEEQQLTQAVARQALFLALQKARRDFPQRSNGSSGLLPVFGPIIAGGSALDEFPNPAHTLLLLLDSVQPVGITNIIVDRNNLLALLGAAAERNRLLPVQVLDSGAFQSIGTVVSFTGSAHEGARIALARILYENGSEAVAEVKFGSLELLPLPHGQNARLSIQPQHGINAGFGPGRPGTLTVSGGLLGVVFDGRGRPLRLSKDPGRRRDQLKKWLWTMGG